MSRQYIIFYISQDFYNNFLGKKRGKFFFSSDIKLDNYFSIVSGE